MAESLVNTIERLSYLDCCYRTAKSGCHLQVAESLASLNPFPLSAKMTKAAVISTLQ